MPRTSSISKSSSKSSTTPSRRDFLRASAALTLPAFVPAMALGRAGRPAASERVTIGHIGVGVRGRPIFNETAQVKAAQSVAVADAFKSRRDKAAADCGGKAYADFRDVLARDDVDAVVIATPDHWHVPMANAAARAGKDAFVEKPLAVSVEQDLACVKTFAATNRVFQYGTIQRSMDHCRLGCELVRAGVIGKLSRIDVLAPNGGTGGIVTPSAVPDDLDYPMWLGPAPEAPYTVDRCKPQGTYWVYDQSIGYLGGWGAHPLDILIWGLATNDDLAGPFTVAGTGKVPTEGLYDCVYDWDMTITFSTGLVVTFKPGGDSTDFIGENGSIRVRRGGLDSKPANLVDTKAIPDSARLPVSVGQVANFVESVRSRQPAVSHLADSVRSDLISQLCNVAVRAGRTITWDPKRQAIVGDDAAARLCHRPMRSPWTI
jgi:predicted dehydrogenase